MEVGRDAAGDAVILGPALGGLVRAALSIAPGRQTMSLKTRRLLCHTRSRATGAVSGLDLLKAGREAPSGTARPSASPQEDERDGSVLACAGCLQPITTAGARIDVGGAHEHTFANPAGFQYHIGCFARATGCATVGEPSPAWSWFAGYSWQVEHCSACREHLGWLFRAEGHLFHGFVIDSLVEVEG